MVLKFSSCMFIRRSDGLFVFAGLESSKKLFYIAVGSIDESFLKRTFLVMLVYWLFPRLTSMSSVMASGSMLSCEICRFGRYSADLILEFGYFGAANVEEFAD